MLGYILQIYAWIFMKETDKCATDVTNIFQIFSPFENSHSYSIFLIIFHCLWKFCCVY